MTVLPALRAAVLVTWCLPATLILPATLFTPLPATQLYPVALVLSAALLGLYRLSRHLVYTRVPRPALVTVRSVSRR
ncbi:hypothetical protein [Deinococcus soli (ex Cha et al. 2016)]|uniref:hypothetical protein n=1 Tax=Deinococcus soli (ex Cha et al. 2016) TaxID=1309411 RepID=UPI00166F0A5D|nr:hypothetical protein [Deinococcus soli (ex Cha et al. 2016)]GGB70743.1 hypothetical protein GCM10008019_28650 [Deinococcus soli (ex Cha et al. 2016)]